MDASRLEFQNIDSMNLDNKTFEYRYVWNYKLLAEDLAIVLSAIDMIGNSQEPYDVKSREKLLFRAEHIGAVLKDISEDTEHVLQGELHRIKMDTETIKERVNNRTVIPINFKRLLLNVDRYDRSPIVKPKNAVLDLYNLQKKLWTYLPPGNSSSCQLQQKQVLRSGKT
jgi:hypothetical protein